MFGMNYKVTESTHLCRDLESDQAARRICSTYSRYVTYTDA